MAIGLRTDSKQARGKGWRSAAAAAVCRARTLKVSCPFAWTYSDASWSTKT